MRERERRSRLSRSHHASATRRDRSLGSGVGHATRARSDNGLPRSGMRGSRPMSDVPEGRLARIWRSRADAGGGTRTPDTRIMIPWRFGSTEPKAGLGDTKGDTTALSRASGVSRRSSHRPTMPRDPDAGARRRCLAWKLIAPAPPLVRVESGSQPGANPALADTWSSSAAGALRPTLGALAFGRKRAREPRRRVLALPWTPAGRVTAPTRGAGTHGASPAR